MTGDKVNVFNPRTDVWDEHFAMQDDFSIVGLTGIGRGTVVRLLQMNTLCRIDTSGGDGVTTISQVAHPSLLPLTEIPSRVCVWKIGDVI